MIIKWKKAAALAVAAALALSACGGSDGGTEGGAAEGATTRGGTLTVGTLNFPTSFANTDSQYGNMALFYQAVYDPLLRAETDGTLKPWLATEWTYNADQTVLTLKLRDDVKFTDGTAFDAAAAAANLERFKGGASPDASNLAGMTAAKAVDATTLEITLGAPDPALLSYLGRNAGLMQSPKSFGAADEATKPVGSGPYIIDTAKTVAESVYTFNANPDYWAADEIHYDTLVLKYINDPAAQINAIKAGEINAINLVNNDALAEVTGAGWTINTSELDWVGLTLVDRDGALDSPLEDPKVRQALSYAFDREAILKGYGAGFGTATNQVFPTSSAGYDKALESQYPYDPAKAKELLAEAGYPDGFELSMPSISILGEAIFAVIKDSLAEIGVTAVYTDVAPADFFADILTPKYPAYLMFLEQSANDWQFINFLVSETAVWNPAHYGDATSKDLISKIQMASDADRAALVKELGAYVFDQAWFIPWYRKQVSFATDAKTTVTMQAGNAVPYLWNYVPKG